MSKSNMTPTKWAEEHLIAFPRAEVLVIPHGINRKAFSVFDKTSGEGDLILFPELTQEESDAIEFIAYIHNKKVRHAEDCQKNVLTSLERSFNK